MKALIKHQTSGISEDRNKQKKVMTIQVTKYSASLHATFSHRSICRVHSVFDHTINVQCDQRLIALTHKEAPLTPMGINLDVTDEMIRRMKVKKNDVLTIDEKGLHLMNYSFALGHHQKIDLSYPCYKGKMEDDALIAFKIHLDSLLLSTEDKGMLLASWKHVIYDQPIQQSFYADHLVKLIRKIQKARSLSDVVDHVSSMVGAGEGLTPSGDDFIGGILAVLTYLSHDPPTAYVKSKLCNEVMQRIDQTTPISKEYLLYAMEGLFNELVSTLFIRHGEHKPYLHYLHKISTIGHSSGVDFLIGMYFGLEIGGILQ